MASKDYLDTLNKQVRKKSLKLTMLQEKKIMQVYNQMGEELLKEYMSFNSTPYQKKMLQEKIKYYNQQVENIVKEYAELQAENVVSAQMEVFKDVFKDYKIDDDFLKMYGKIDKECVNYIIKGNLYSNGKGLSERLWNIGKVQGKNIQDIIVEGQLQGLGAVKLGKLLQVYTSGNNGAWKNACKKLGASYAYQITKAGVSYEALRLARTTIAHTAQVSLMTSVKFNPFVDGVRWNTSNSDRVCPRCRDKDGVVFTKEDVPFDHPNGMCYQTVVITKSGKEIGEEVGAWVGGEENPQLDKWAKQMEAFTKIPPSKLISAKANNQAPKVKTYKTYSDKYELMDSNISRTGAKFVKQLSNLEHEALYDYTRDGYYEVNRQLRYGIDYNRANQIMRISEALRKFKAPEDFMVYRGADLVAIESMFSNSDEYMEVYEKILMGEASEDYLKKKFVGGTIVDKGFMSTSAYETGRFDKEVVYHIKVNKGSNYGAYINELSGYKDVEFEYLIDKNVAMEVSNADIDKDGKLNLYLNILGYAK